MTIGDQQGADFQAFGGQLSGTVLSVVRPTLVVQPWRSVKFNADDPDSTLTLSFAPQKDQGRIDLVHVDVPDMISRTLSKAGRITTGNHGESTLIEINSIESGKTVKLSDVECERLPYVTTDYFGRPRPADRSPTVGPIQDLDRRVGHERPVVLEVWPNAAPDRPRAIDMRIKIKDRPIVR